MKNQLHNNPVLSQLLQSYDRKLIDLFLANLIKYRGEKIYFVGIGFSTTITHHVSRRFNLYNIMAYDGSPIDFMVGKIKPTMAIFVSKSGESRDVIEIATRSKTYGYETFAVTSTKENTLNQVCDNCFPLTGFESGNPYSVCDVFVGQAILFFESLIAEYFNMLTDKNIPIV